MSRRLDDSGQRMDDSGIIVIAGPAGIGKTALAARWGNQVADRFPDGQLWLDLRGFDPMVPPAEPAEAIRMLLDALSIPRGQVPATLGGQTGLYRTAMAGRTILLVLDNARDASQVRPLLPGQSACLVVVTSRTRLTGLVAIEGALPLALSGLSFTEARQSFAARVGTERLQAEPEAADELVALCGGLPLALGIMAARLATSPRLRMADLLAQFRSTHRSLDVFDSDDLASNMRAVFACSYRTLAPDARRMFRLLGLHPGPDLGVTAASSLAGWTRRRAGEALRMLSAEHLVTEGQDDRYTMHDLLRAYAREMAEQNEDAAGRDAALGRLLDHYLHASRAAMKLVSSAPHVYPVAPARAGVAAEDIAATDEAIRWFTAERKVLASAVHAHERRLPGHAWRIAAALGTYLNRSGDPHGAIDVLTPGLRAATAAGDRHGLAHVNLRLGRSYIALRAQRTAVGHISAALGHLTGLADLTGQGIAHQYLSMAYEAQEDYQAALDSSRAALDAFTAAGDQRGAAGTLNGIGWLHMQLKDYDKGLADCRRALVLNRGIGSRAAEAETLDSIGYAYHHLGEYSQALIYYLAALEIHRELGRDHLVADTQVHIGDSHYATGNVDLARESWQDAFTLLSGLEHPNAPAVAEKLDRIRRL